MILHVYELGHPVSEYEDDFAIARPASFLDKAVVLRMCAGNNSATPGTKYVWNGWSDSV
jgi:hypothetical protein